MPPTISHIRTVPFELPMKGALQWGNHSRIDTLRHLLVEVELSDGAIGRAEAPPRPTIYGETIYSIIAILEHEIAPRIVGFDTERWQSHGWAVLDQVKNNHTAKGALDMAVYDALATSQGKHLADLLGATVPAFSISYILGLGDREALLDEARSVYEQGVRVLKVKIGRDWQADVALIRALKDTYENRVALYVDANETMSPDDAQIRLCELREMGVLYCEEPLPVYEVNARAELRSAGVLPLIADDSAMTYTDLLRETTLDTFDMLNIKTARTGYSESLKMLEAATGRSKGVMVGSQASATLGTARAALLAARPEIAYPCELSFFLKVESDIVINPLPIVDGLLYLRDVIEVSVDPQLVEAARIRL